jgi:hypothetical protein
MDTDRHGFGGTFNSDIRREQACNLQLATFNAPACQPDNLPLPATVRPLRCDDFMERVAPTEPRAGNSALELGSRGFGLHLNGTTAALQPAYDFPIHCLRRTRDLLLPRLLSRDITAQES